MADEIPVQTIRVQMSISEKNASDGSKTKVERPSGNRRVLIVQTYCPQYRKPFFEGLRNRLALHGVHLDLAHGDPIGGAADKSDAVQLPWAKRISNRRIGIGRRHLVYQPIARLARTYDLVIVEQANKLLVNPLIMIMGKLGLTRMAFWGHGKDFQGYDSPAARAFKRWQIPHVHWWFAYNAKSAEVVRSAGFPDERITRVMNTIDNEDLAQELNKVTAEEIEQQKSRLGLKGINTCIYVGGMNEKKRVPFLLEACERIRQAVPDFEIVFLGSGPDRPLIDAFAARYDWAVSCGATFGHEKAVLLKFSKLLLIPGAVGLVIIDAFLARVPIVTTDDSSHGPEIDYLIDGVNGEMVSPPDDANKYAAAVAEILNDDARLDCLRQCCGATAPDLTLDKMIQRYADGVLAALNV